MEKPDLKAIAQAMIEATSSFVAKATAPIIARVTSLEAKLATIPAGPKGDRGEKGEKGDAGQVDPELLRLVAAETLPRMVDSAQAVLGERLSAWLAAVPAPKDGADGAPGAQGETGPRGEQGSAGACGAPGPQGPKGEAGPRGEVGERGAIGERGERGADGLPGPAGASIKGEQGERGPEGAAGVRGEKGDQGVQGERGPAGAPGMNGDPGPAGESIKGEAGQPGKDGRDGKDADPELVRVVVAETLPALVQRAQDILTARIDAAVAAIPAPKDGKDGAVGDTGKSGERGAAGAQGEPGRDAAELDILPSIDESKSYRRGTWASHNGGLIRAARQTEAVKDGAIIDAGWVVMVEGLACPPVITQGEDPRELTVASMLTSGTKAVSVFRMPVMIYKEVWREGEYELGDVVTWSGSAWHCQRPKTTGKPGECDEWKMMVKQGSHGRDWNDPKAKARETVRLPK